MNTLKEAAQAALDVQSASNLSGVVYAFARAMEVVCREERDHDKRQRHPVCVLFATQVGHLTGVSECADIGLYNKSHAECERIAALADEDIEPGACSYCESRNIAKLDDAQWECHDCGEIIGAQDGPTG